ncbi:Scarecrow-like protein 6 [Linum grandiflorum]
MPFHLEGKGGLDIASIFSQQEAWKHNNKHEVNSFTEPISVLHMRRSPSPPTSASTLSSSFNGGAGAGDTATPTAGDKALNDRKDEWANELQPIPAGGLDIVSSAGERCGLGLDDWENMLSEPTQEQSLLRWISGGDVDDSSFGLKHLLQSGSNNNNGGNNPLDFDGNGGGGLGIVDQGHGFEGIGGIGGGVSGIGSNLGAFPGSGFVGGMNNGRIGGSAAAAGLQQQVDANLDEKPHVLMNPHHLNAHQPAPNFFFPLPFPQQDHHHQQPQPKRQNSGGHNNSMEPNLPQMMPKLPFSDPGHDVFLRKQQQQHQQQQQLGFPPGVPFLLQGIQPPLVGKEDPGGQQQQQQHALLDQLYKAAELVGTGNFTHAQGILARLNQQLSPIGKPLQRAAFYFKEALQLLLIMNNNPVTAPLPRTPTPFDVIFKMGAYKVFSEVSPLIQFVNFTCNQALLEALEDADRIHIVDFDIGFGAQWASFMQELPRSRGPPSLKITAFASPSTHHPIELGLMRENLTQFANEIGVSFELDVVNFDSLDQNCFSLPIFRASENEAVAVNFPIWSCSNQPSALPSLLRLVKQLNPKIVVSLDRGCDRSDLPFPQHILHALQSYIHLFESLDAVNVTGDALNKIERFLLQPRIESTVLGRLRTPDKMPNWKTIFASAGFSPVTFSNFTETQAECVLKRTQVRGFHVEKRHASLVLCWQRRELISASAWRC